MDNFCEHYYLNIIVSINPFSPLNVTVNITLNTLKYYSNEALTVRRLDFLNEVFSGRGVNLTRTSYFKKN